jgi:subtilisin family serine protease
MTLAHLFRRACCAALLLGAACAPASAQLRLPSLSLPQQLGPVELGRLQRPADQLLDRAPLPDLGRLRLDQVSALLARHPDLLEADPSGNVAVRSEILAWSPSAAALQAAAVAGLTISRQQDYVELGQRLVVLRVPSQTSTASLLQQLRALDPDGVYDFNHVYTASGGAGQPADPARPASAEGNDKTQTRVGLVDSGVDGAHPVFENVAIKQWGCDGQPHPAPHGTAVAALMVGRSEYFHGAAPGADLFAADIYCDAPVGGSVDRIAAALAWLARQEVGVINISLVGPANAALARAVAAMQARGHLLVAAVGNDGPAAPPLYPASYPGVIGVSGVDRRGRPLPEAARGPQVAFAAPGSQMVSAEPGAPPYRQVRGTSYAAPIVAGLLAKRLHRPDTRLGKQAVAELARQAVRPDASTVSNETGYGVVGAELRTDPARLR